MPLLISHGWVLLKVYLTPGLGMLPALVCRLVLLLVV